MRGYWCSLDPTTLAEQTESNNDARDLCRAFWDKPLLRRVDAEEGEAPRPVIAPISHLRSL
jgi:hypothetical protein